MLLQTAIYFSAYLISFAVILQALEILAIRKTWDAKGIWQYSIIQQEIPKGLKTLFHEKVFLRLLIFQILFALTNMYFVNPISLFMMLAVSLITSLRWRGTFNGGSDAMTTHILAALFLAVAFKNASRIEMACLWYIAIQFVFSYFMAGYAKIRQKDWRNGSALAFFVQKSNYAVPETFQKILSHRPVALLASWLLIVFELVFPLALTNTRLALSFIVLSFLFHIANFVVFGLNRFVFAWAAAYPIIYFLAGH